MSRPYLYCSLPPVFFTKKAKLTSDNPDLTVITNNQYSGPTQQRHSTNKVTIHLHSPFLNNANPHPHFLSGLAEVTLTQSAPHGIIEQNNPEIEHSGTYIYINAFHIFAPSLAISKPPSWYWNARAWPTIYTQAVAHTLLLSAFYQAYFGAQNNHFKYVLISPTFPGTFPWIPDPLPPGSLSRFTRAAGWARWDPLSAPSVSPLPPFGDRCRPARFVCTPALLSPGGRLDVRLPTPRRPDAAPAPAPAPLPPSPAVRSRPLYRTSVGVEPRCPRPDVSPGGPDGLSITTAASCRSLSTESAQTLLPSSRPLTSDRPVSGGSRSDEGGATRSVLGRPTLGPTADVSMGSDRDTTTTSSLLRIARGPVPGRPGRGGPRRGALAACRTLASRSSSPAALDACTRSAMAPTLSPGTGWSAPAGLFSLRPGSRDPGGPGAGATSGAVAGGVADAAL